MAPLCFVWEKLQLSSVGVSLSQKLVKSEVGGGCGFQPVCFSSELVQDNALCFLLTSCCANLAKTRPPQRWSSSIKAHLCHSYVIAVPWCFQQNDSSWLSLEISALLLQYQGHISDMFDSASLRPLCLFLQLITSQPFPGRCSLFFLPCNVDLMETRPHTCWLPESTNAL